MQLAADEITIRVASEVIVLRPSLRAALRIERHFGGFENAVKAILEENVTAMAYIIHESAEEPTRFPALLEEIGAKPLRIGLAQLAGPLLTHIYRLAGVDINDPTPAAEDAAPSRMDCPTM